MKDNHTPGPTIHRFIYYSPGRRIDHQFVELGYYQRQSDLLGECLEAIEGAMRIKDLWLYHNEDEIYDDDLEAARALATMESNFKAILAKTKEERDEKQKDEQRN